MVNKIDYLPVLTYDSWALVNFTAELEKARKKLSKDDLKLLDKLQKEFELINIKSLPQSLVHGDLISTNIMKDKSKIYFVDFSVANSRIEPVCRRGAFSAAPSVSGFLLRLRRWTENRRYFVHPRSLWRVRGGQKSAGSELP